MSEPDELLQWFCHDDSTIKIGICIIIIIKYTTVLRTSQRKWCSQNILCALLDQYPFPTLATWCNTQSIDLQSTQHN